MQLNSVGFNAGYNSALSAKKPVAVAAVRFAAVDATKDPYKGQGKYLLGAGVLMALVLGGTQWTMMKSHIKKNDQSCVTQMTKAARVVPAANQQAAFAKMQQEQNLPTLPTLKEYIAAQCENYKSPNAVAKTSH